MKTPIPGQQYVIADAAGQLFVATCEGVCKFSTNVSSFKTEGGGKVDRRHSDVLGQKDVYISEMRAINARLQEAIAAGTATQQLRIKGVAAGISLAQLGVSVCQPGHITIKEVEEAHKELADALEEDVSDDDIRDKALDLCDTLDHYYLFIGWKE